MGIDASQWFLPAYLRSVKAVGGTASVEAIRVHFPLIIPADSCNLIQ